MHGGLMAAVEAGDIEVIDLLEEWDCSQDIIEARVVTVAIMIVTVAAVCEASDNSYCREHRGCRDRRDDRYRCECRIRSDRRDHCNRCIFREHCDRCGYRYRCAAGGARSACVTRSCQHSAQHIRHRCRTHTAGSSMVNLNAKYSRPIVAF